MGKASISSGPIRPALEGPGTEHAIIFVHGLGGAPASTWSTMLELISGDTAFDHVTLDCYAYPTRLVSIPWLAPPPGLKEIAEGLQTFLHDRFSHYKRIDLVAHSLGGVVTRTFLVDEVRTGLRLPIKKAALIAVPNSGTSLASVGHQVSYRHKQLKALCKSSEEVEATDKAWREQRVVDKIGVRYILGGQDRCVPRESACNDAGETPAMLINADHRNIIAPSDRQDSRYTVLTKFILSNAKSSAAKLRPADPLFEQYKPEHEPYYVERSFDIRLSEAISSGHIWLCGRSGVGKSAALRRAVHRNSWTLSHLSLSSYEDCSPIGMICALADELAILATNAAAGLSDRSFEAACRSIRTNLSALCASETRAVIVEEIPLSANALPEFLDYLSRMLQMINGCDGIADRLVFAFSSIINLSKSGLAISGKARETIQIVSDPEWSVSDLQKLVGLLAGWLKRSVTIEELNQIGAAADGRPRLVKLLFRYYRNGNDQGEPLVTLLDKVRSEQI